MKKTNTTPFEILDKNVTNLMGKLKTADWGSSMALSNPEDLVLCQILCNSAPKEG